jgi:rhodanese-related sulfurtransferase
MSKRYRLHRIMRRITFLALLGLLLALPGCRSMRQRVERRMAAHAAHRPPYTKVTPPIAYEIIRDNPDILILDLRSPKAFNSDTGHIFRADNIPLDRLPYRLIELSAVREDTFLVYCDTRTCAEEGMAVLVSSGFENAILMDGGIDGWIERGFRTVLPSDVAARTAERTATGKGGLQPPPGTPPATAVEDATTAPPPPPPR